jgi:predicted metal-dependent enzyme (double-stranded beta helix superfamily)
MATKLVMSLILVASSWSCAGRPEGESHGSRGVSAAKSLHDVIEETMAEARRAVNEHGVTEVAMLRIQAALGQLARAPGLKKQNDLRELHGGGAASAVLSSDGLDDLTLILARFQPGRSTPIHDHGTWAVAYVVEGKDRYTQWERLDDGGNSEHAKLQVKYERTLGPGDAVYWFDPPHDIHSQEAIQGITWELLLFGRNPLGGTLHYFDAATGRVTTKEPVTASPGSDASSSGVPD